MCVFILIYLQYILYSTKYIVFSCTTKSGQLRVAQRRGTVSWKIKILAFLRISFSIRLRSARPQSPTPTLTDIYLHTKVYYNTYTKKKEKHLALETVTHRGYRSASSSFLFQRPISVNAAKMIRQFFVEIKTLPILLCWYSKYEKSQCENTIALNI